MTRISLILLIVSILFPFSAAKAQENLLFPDLQQAIANGEREKTRLFLTRAVDEVLIIPDKEIAVQRILDISNGLSRTGQAEVVWPNLLRLAGNKEITKALTAGLVNTLWQGAGAACYFDNRFEPADSLFRLTLPYTRVEGQEIAYAFSCNFLGLINRRLGRLDSALYYFERALDTRIQVYGEKHSQVGAIYNNIGLLYKSTGDYDKALANFQKAVDIKMLTNDHSVHINYLNLGELCSLQGNYSTALSFFKQAELIVEKEAASEKLADLYLNTGGILSTLQAFREANDYFVKALHIYDAVLGENSVKSGKVYQNMANVYSGTGDNEKELESTNKALEIFIAAYGPDHQEVAPLYNNLGMLYLARKRFEESLGLFFQASRIYRNLGTGQTDKLANTLTNMATAYQQFGQPDSAVSLFTEAIGRLDAAYQGRHPYLAYACNSLAQLCLDKKEYEKAEEYTRKAISSNLSEAAHGVTQSCLDPDYYFRSLLLSGRIQCQYQNGQPDGLKPAFAFFRSADSLLSIQRNFLYDQSDKIDFARNSALLAESALDCLSASDFAHRDHEYLREAFRYAEKSKNLVLLQAINENNAKAFSGIPDSILHRENELLSRIHFYTHEVEMDKIRGLESPSEEKLFSLKKSYKSLIENLEKNYPRYYELKYREEIPSVSGLQSALGKETALLVYFRGDHSSYRFTLLRDKLRFDKLDASDLDDLLVGMRKGITLRLDDIYREKAEKLYRLLIPSALPLEIKNLVIVTNRDVSLIPFEALLFQPAEKTPDYSAWPYLIKKFTVRYAPSLALWSKLHQPRETSISSSSFLGFAPVFAEKNLMVTDSIRDGSILTGTDYPVLSPLPASAEEVSAAYTIFREQGNSAETHLFTDASERNLVTADLSRFDYIHIATHGMVNVKNPALSALYFYPIHDSLYDDVLYMGEILNLRLNARLVVLSACETGLGKLAAGEGTLGFSRAFLNAGARNLILSLWKVNDASTTGLMTQFYKFHLSKGLTLTESLRNAKLSLIGNPLTSHPFFWAPFVLSGN